MSKVGKGRQERLKLDETIVQEPRLIKKGFGSFMTFRKIILIICFWLFMFPLYSEDGLAYNYSYVLLPLFYLLMGKKLLKPGPLLSPLIVLYTLIFVVAFIYQYEFYGEIRRISSFMIFIGMFSYTFIKIDEDRIQCFKIAIVASGVIYAIYTANQFLTFGGVELGSSAKGVVGSQRIGFFYLLGIWLTFFYRSNDKSSSILKYLIIFILLVGLLLTFSRSSIISLAGSFGLYSLSSLFNMKEGLKMKINLIVLLKKIFMAIVVGGVLTFALYTFLPSAFDYFNQYLILYALDPEAVAQDFGDSESSGGYRVHLIATVIDYIVHNPLTGSGYLGVWVLGDDLGSAHNQYLDVLFRTGILGFLAYIYLLYLLMRYLYVYYADFFWGVAGILIYGIFHETFKLPIGGFIFAFLLGMLAQHLRDKRQDLISGRQIGIGD